MSITKPVALLSSTVINKSGNYEVICDVPMADIKHNFKGVPSYVHHPSTAALLKELGAIELPKDELFEGLLPGQFFYAVQLVNPRNESGWTVDKAVKDLGELKVTVVLCECLDLDEPDGEPDIDENDDYLYD